MRHAQNTLAALVACFLFLTACGEGEGDYPELDGGMSGGGRTGGAKATGGTGPTGGIKASGGTAGGAGTKATGGGGGRASGGSTTGGAKATGGVTGGTTGGTIGGTTGGTIGGTTGSAGRSGTGGLVSTGGAGTGGAGGTKATGGAQATGGATGGTRATGGSAGASAGSNGGGGKASGGRGGDDGAAGRSGGAGGKSGDTGGIGGSTPSGGASGQGGATAAWANIRVVGNHMRDRWGKPFAVRSIESMFGNGTSNASSFVAGHKALGANALGPMPNTSASDPDFIEALLSAAYAAGLVVGLNADHANQGERYFQNKQLQTIVNRYPNVFLQEAVELGSELSEDEWVAAAKKKIDAYVGLYPDKPLKIGSPDGGRSPRYALDRCQDVVSYYASKGGRGGVIFTCQLYWKAANASWSYQKENGFKDGLPGILEAIDAMAASPCFFMPGLDHQDDVGYTGWREVMDHIRQSQADQALRTSFQWWVYYNAGDTYDNDLTTKPNDALSGITDTGREVKAKLEMDRKLIELGPLNP